MKQDVLLTQNVTKIYTNNNEAFRAVDQVDLKIQSGEFVALVGPSGSGKTTLLAMMAALLNPSEGQVFIDGVALGTLSETTRVNFRKEKIGFTFQSNNLLPFLTVKENVAMMLRLNNRLDAGSRLRVVELLERLGLEQNINKLPNQLSGGQRQRVAIARSLIHNPSLVLADEPTASLDSERAFQVVQIFADLIHEQNKAGVMVTHDLRMCRYVDRVVQMRDGRIETILDKPEEIEAFIGCSGEAPIPVQIPNPTRVR